MRRQTSLGCASRTHANAAEITAAAEIPAAAEIKAAVEIPAATGFTDAAAAVRDGCRRAGMNA